MTAKKPTPANSFSVTTAALAVDGAGALPSPAYEPPTLTPLGALQELLTLKTDVLDADWQDQGAEDPRLKL